MTDEEQKQFTDLFDDNHDGEMNSYTHQVIFWINELLKKREAEIIHGISKLTVKYPELKTAMASVLYQSVMSNKK